MGKMKLTQIGIIHTPFKERKGTPIQPKMGKGIEGRIEVFDAYVPGLKDLDGFSHIILIYYVHLAEGYSLEVIPYLDDKRRGLFATRAPKRPSPIGLSVVRLKEVNGNTLIIEDIDIVDQTPLLDIKPYIPNFGDEPREIRIGWLKDRLRDENSKKADDRF
jgi:tRNA-Thr(GGU) m(6)t(6)A37 methyltransferase TsaA